MNEPRHSSPSSAPSGDGALSQRRLRCGRTIDRRGAEARSQLAGTVEQPGNRASGREAPGRGVGELHPGAATCSGISRRAGQPRPHPVRAAALRTRRSRTTRSCSPAIPVMPTPRAISCFCRLQCCDWSSFESDRETMLARLRAGQRVLPPVLERRAVWRRRSRPAHRRADRRARQVPARSAVWRGEPYRHDRIRVAYVSADFHAHATAVLMAGVSSSNTTAPLRNHRDFVRTGRRKPMRERLNKCVRPLHRCARQERCGDGAAMRGLEIDIAIDLKGYTSEARPAVFSLRPAPVQVNYLGFPGTMGAPFMDYLIADRIVVPDEHKAFYSEQIVWLPDTYQANDRSRETSGQDNRPRKCGAAGNRIRVLLLQQQLQDLAADLRCLDAAAARRAAERAVAAGGQRGGDAQSQTRSRLTRHRSRTPRVRGTQAHLPEHSGAAPIGRSVSRHTPLQRAHDSIGRAMDRASRRDLHGKHLRRTRGREPAACGRSARARDRIAR